MLSNFFTSFMLGLLTPLTALCVLPLYPGFISYLSSKFSSGKSEVKIKLLGVMVTVGVITFMISLGLLFTTILRVSLTNVIGIISPIAFGILLIISLLLIFNVDIGKYLPKYHAKVGKNPVWSAFLFGFFFGAIVIPCNPAFIAAFFTRALLFTNFLENMVNFLMFGVGLSFPLLLFTFISSVNTKRVLGFLNNHTRKINFVSGLLMFVISLYYLLFVFKILGGIF